MIKWIKLLPNYTKIIIICAVMFFLAQWVQSLITVRSDAIDLKDTAATQVQESLHQELRRTQANVVELEKSLALKDIIISSLNKSNGNLNALRDRLESDLQKVRGQKGEIESVLRRYELNYSQEAIRDVEAVEDTTNVTISDLMREHEALTCGVDSGKTGNR